MVAVKGNIMDKIFEIDSSFHVKWSVTGKVQFLVFSSFPKILGLKLLGKS